MIRLNQLLTVCLTGSGWFFGFTQNLLDLLFLFRRKRFEAATQRIDSIADNDCLYSFLYSRLDAIHSRSEYLPYIDRLYVCLIRDSQYISRMPADRCFHRLVINTLQKHGSRFIRNLGPKETNAGKRSNCNGER